MRSWKLARSLLSPCVCRCVCRGLVGKGKESKESVLTDLLLERLGAAGVDVGVHGVGGWWWLCVVYTYIVGGIGSRRLVGSGRVDNTCIVSYYQFLRTGLHLHRRVPAQVALLVGVEGLLVIVGEDHRVRAGHLPVVSSRCCCRIGVSIDWSVSEDRRTNRATTHPLQQGSINAINPFAN